MYRFRKSRAVDSFVAAGFVRRPIGSCPIAGDLSQPAGARARAYGSRRGLDTTVRILAQKLSEKLGQQFVIENRPGAGGIIAMKAIPAPSDGYT